MGLPSRTLQGLKERRDEEVDAGALRKEDGDWRSLYYKGLHGLCEAEDLESKIPAKVSLF